METEVNKLWKAYQYYKSTSVVLGKTDYLLLTYSWMHKHHKTGRLYTSVPFNCKCMENNKSCALRKKETRLWKSMSVSKWHNVYLVNFSFFSFNNYMNHQNRQCISEFILLHFFSWMLFSGMASRDTSGKCIELLYSPNWQPTFHRTHLNI